ncbi:unnamed protein product, partial [Ectocarpus fasciculatus]
GSHHLPSHGLTASDLGVGSVMGGMRNTPSSSFLRSSFGQLTDLQVESMHQLQQQHVLGGGQSLNAGGANGSSSGSSTMQVVPQHYLSLMGSRRTSAEDFLSLLQDSEELQAREVPSMQDEEPEDSSSQSQPQPQPQHALLPPPARVPHNGGAGGSSGAAHPTSTPHPPQEATRPAA